MPEPFNPFTAAEADAPAPADAPPGGDAEEADPDESAIKAGARHSAADMAILKAMSGAVRDYLKARGESAAGFTAQMRDYLKALGHADDEEEPEPEPPAEADEGGDEALMGEPAVKALDLATRCELVEAAIVEALEELGLMDDDDMGEMAPYVARILKCEGEGRDPDPEIYVYDDHAVVCLDSGDWLLLYTIEGGQVVLADPDEWQLVEKEWRPVPGAAPITEAEGGGDAVKAMGDAVKVSADGTIEGYAVRFGAPDEPDISAMRDYFTKATDFWLDAWDRRPMLYHHGLDPATKAAPRIGEWVQAGVDEVGVWLRGQLDQAHRYHEAIKELARRGLLRISSDSAPHLVIRAPQANGTNEVKRWPITAASLTVSAAEPRLLPVELKSLLADLGLVVDTSPEADAPADTERPHGAEGDAGQAARRLAVELDLLELETL